MADFKLICFGITIAELGTLPGQYHINVAAKAFCIFSSVRIKVKRSMKERFVGLADSLMRLFS